MASTGKIALITGGNRGLGRATALALAEAGTDVILTYRSNADEAAEVVEMIIKGGGKAAALSLDTSHIDTFEQFASAVRDLLQQHWDRDSFDFLVNNAGAAAFTPLGKTSEADFDMLVDVHFKGVYFLTQTLAPLIADGGRIINLSSGLARFATVGFSVYGSLKGAVEVLTRYLAVELGERGITVNAVAPGAIATDFGGGAVRDNEQMRQHIAGATALGRVGEADDIGPVIAALLGDGMGWVNAQRIEASGGVNL